MRNRVEIPGRGQGFKKSVWIPYAADGMHGLVPQDRITADVLPSIRASQVPHLKIEAGLPFLRLSALHQDPVGRACTTQRLPERTGGQAQAVAIPTFAIHHQNLNLPGQTQVLQPVIRQDEADGVLLTKRSGRSGSVGPCEYTGQPA